MKDFLEKVEGGQTKNDLDFDNPLNYNDSIEVLKL